MTSVLVTLSKMNLHPWIINYTSLMVNGLIKSDTDDLKTNLALPCILFSLCLSNVDAMVKSYSSITVWRFLQWSTVVWFAQWKIKWKQLILAQSVRRWSANESKKSHRVTLSCRWKVFHGLNNWSVLTVCGCHWMSLRWFARIISLYTH